MYRQDENTQNDNELADFADRVLQGKIDPIASSPDEERIGLEKTILRLATAFPPEPLEDAKSKQMLVRLKARMRREEEAAKPSFWKRLFDIQSNPQVGLLVAAAVVVMLLMVSLPSIEQPPGSSVSGTAVSGTSLFTILGLVGLLIVVYWISRRN